MNLILFVLIGATIYSLFETLCERRILQKINKYICVKNEFYYREFLKKYEKSKKVKMVEKLNIKYRINLLIEKAGLKHNIFINPIMLICYGGICFGIAYIFSFLIFKLIGLAIIISLPCMLIPFFILNVISLYKAEKLEKIFLNFLLQLKNYTKISNDVVSALKSVQTIEPLQSYLNKFNIEINSGIKFEIAIEHLKDKIVITKFKEFFTNVQYCYLYGGDFCTLIDKSYKIINDIQKEKSKRKQETQGARLVLIILMLLNVFVYINFVRNNNEHYMIMKNTVPGLIILYWNFISMWFLLILAEKVKKLDY